MIHLHRIAAVALLVCAAAPARAHVASNGFLTLSVDGARITGSVELAVRDAELAVELDTNHDGRVTWGELRAAAPALAQYLSAHLALTGDSRPCALGLSGLRVDRRIDGSYAWWRLGGDCPRPVHELTVAYDALQDVDPSHRALLTLRAGEVTETAVLGPAAPARFEIGAPARMRTFETYFGEGVRHIWSGIDHLLFLLSLLLPAVLARREGRWQPLPGVGAAASGIVKVVTAFTLAHSITLTLAALGVIHLPSRLTESAIAASIVVAALNNLRPVVTEGRARLGFAFGLLHGFGFASVLAEMGLPAGARLLSLFAFNLGIEAGQLAVVAAVMPIAYAARGKRAYATRFMPAGSALIALIALGWFVQRAFLGG